jgi:arsenical pump membrane protein
MHALIACSTFAVAVTLAVSRPRIVGRLRVGPASAAVAGTACLMLAGTVRPADLAVAVEALWRPLLTVLSIMVTTAAAREVGVLETVAARVLSGRTTSLRRLFTAVFALGVVTATILSNDAAILLLTPLVLTFVARQYPDHPGLLVPFGFAVFMAAGVAPFVTSNPMNMVVASYVGLNFNDYAMVMVPVALVGSATTWLVLLRVFAADLDIAVPPTAAARQSTAFRPAEKKMLALVAGVTATYPFVAMFDGGAIWVVAVVGAAVAVALACADGRVRPARVLGRGVAWDVLVFLPAVFVLSIGLKNVGLVDVLAGWYQSAGLSVLGVTAAMGSAVMNNHPMALINMLALETRPDAGVGEFLAVLVGGDLGPRLLPTGSLAGLLWLESCRRFGVHVAPGHFIRVGLFSTAPTLVVSLAVLSLFR